MPTTMESATPLRRSPRKIRPSPLGTQAGRSRNRTSPARHSIAIGTSEPEPPSDQPQADPPLHSATGSRVQNNTVFRYSLPSISSGISLPDFHEVLLEQENNNMKALLEKIIKAVKEAGTCPMCFMFMLDPYITRCGHVACAHCLKAHVKVKMTSKLRAYRHIDHDGHSREECTTAPETERQRDRLLVALRAHGRDPRFSFRFPCPMCRQTLYIAPAYDYGLRGTLSPLWQLLNRKLGMEATPPTPVAPFEFLFLPHSSY
ncbi:hypothetical protein BKA70DRAFT_1223223 [Coprinopsis sp. MPI-PUGE-AT-0042]|nr:hypothetical protein BKA70DRAFT_1223223 [Coprinopsis sp. MPI-PUGE-AT-0042]